MAEVTATEEPPCKKPCINFELPSESHVEGKNLISADSISYTSRASGGSDNINTFYGEFQLLDEVNVEDSQGESEYDSTGESEVPEEEIDALLEEGLPDEMKGPMKRRRENKDSNNHVVDGIGEIAFKEKTVLIDKGNSSVHFDILPEGWVRVSHSSGMPVYLHKPTRVCAFSKPFYVGTAGVRRFEPPLNSIPCLQYRRALEEEKKKKSEQIEKNSNDGDIHNSLSSSSDTNSDSQNTAMKSEIGNDNNTKPVNPLLSALALDNNTDHDINDSARMFAQNSKIEAAVQNLKQESLKPEELNDYCKTLFLFTTLRMPAFNSWVERRNYEKKMKSIRKKSMLQFPEGAKLVSLKSQDSDGNSLNNGKKWLLNPKGKSYICILHEYVQHALKFQPRYVFHEVENSATPYAATMMINNMKFATGYGSSKKLAKADAAKKTLEILLPELGEKIRKESNISDDEDLAFFDEIKIEDPRVPDLCNKASELPPFSVLMNCLQRNFGHSGTNIQCNLITKSNQKNEFCMTVGKHTVQVQCKNKKDGKQKAAQAILQKLHPYIKNWGSLLRLYGNRSMQPMKERKAEEQEITLLQSNATDNQPNTSILKKLREEMLKLHEKKKTVVPIGTFLPPEGVDLPMSFGANLGGVDL